MRVEVRTGARTLIGHCEIPESVWEPAWRTGWLHMFGPASATMLSPGGPSNPTRAESERWTFVVTTEQRVGNSLVGENDDYPRELLQEYGLGRCREMTVTHHFIQCDDVNSGELLPGFEPCALEPRIIGRTYVDGRPDSGVEERQPRLADLNVLATGGRVRIPPEFFADEPRDNSAMRLDAELRAQERRDNPMFRVTTPPGGIQVGDELRITGQAHDSVVVEVNHHSLTLEVAGELDLDTEQHADIARRIAARLDDQVMEGLRSMYVNGEQVWDRDAEGSETLKRIAQEPTPMATTTAGKRDIAL